MELRISDNELMFDGYKQRAKDYLLKNSNYIFFANVFLSVLVGFVGFYHLRKSEIEKQSSQHAKIVQDFHLAFEHYIHPLQGIASTLHYSKLKLSSREFRTAAESRDLFSNFKGALGFGFIRRVHPEETDEYLSAQRKERPDFQLKRIGEKGDRPLLTDFFVIEFVEPVEKNRQAVGLVISDEQNRYRAALKAMRTGMPTITLSIQLVQAEKTEPGFLYYLPIYRTPNLPRTVDEREKYFMGLAYAPLLLSQINEFVLSQNQYSLPFSISEIDQTGTPNQLFVDQEFKTSLMKGLPLSTSKIQIAGQEWVISSTMRMDTYYSTLSKSVAMFVLCILTALVFYFYQRLMSKKINFNARLVELSRQEVAQATQSLNENRRFLQSIIDGLPVVVAYWDHELRSQLHNRASEEFLGVQSSGAIGQRVSELQPKQVYEADLPFVRKALNGHPQEIERTSKNKLGEDRILLIKFQPYFAQDKVEGCIVIALDITNMRQLEMQNRENEALLYSKAKLSLLGEMAGGIAHEINNPLAIIKGKSDLAQQLIKSINVDESVRSKLTKHIVGISSTVDRIARIISGLKSFSRDSEKDPYQNVLLGDVVNDTLGLVGELLKFKRITIQVIGVSDERFVFCNKTQIEQVIMNLISNSIDAISDLDEKWIRIEITDEKNRWNLRVTDAGRGIDNSIVDKMMNPFFTTKEVGKGTGLGLSISQGILKAHKASLYYELHHGHTSFVVSFEKSKFGTVRSAA